jgi:HlyD family secretion protein
MKSSFSGLLRAFLIILGLGVLGGGGYAAWLWLGHGSHGPTYRTEKVTVGNLTATIGATGTIEPETVNDIGAQITGQIKFFGDDPRGGGRLIDYRSPVEEGTVLAKIDDSLYAAQRDNARAMLDQADAALEVARAQVNEAKANLARSEADLEQLKAHFDQNYRDWLRARQLTPKKVIADSDLDAAEQAYKTSQANVGVGEAAIVQARASLVEANANEVKARAGQAAARAALKQAEVNLGYCTIRSPIKGVIVDRRVNVGQTVVSSLSASSLFLIAKDLTRLQVWCQVNEADVGNIKARDTKKLKDFLPEVLQGLQARAAGGNVTGFFNTDVLPEALARLVAAAGGAEIVIPGQKVTFTLDTYPRDVFEGEVLQIRYNASMTQNVVTYTVVVETTNPPDRDHPDGKLLPYLTASAKFIVEERKGVKLVPNAALRYRPQIERILPSEKQAYEQSQRGKSAPGEEGASPSPAKASRRSWVFVEENGFLRPIRIRTGLSDGKNTEVIEVLDGAELNPDTPLVTGEKAADGSFSNPFGSGGAGKKKEA